MVSDSYSLMRSEVSFILVTFSEQPGMVSPRPMHAVLTPQSGIRAGTSSSVKFRLSWDNTTGLRIAKVVLD